MGDPFDIVQDRAVRPKAPSKRIGEEVAPDSSAFTSFWNMPTPALPERGMRALSALLVCTVMCANPSDSAANNPMPWNQEPRLNFMRSIFLFSAALLFHNALFAQIPNVEWRQGNGGKPTEAAASGRVEPMTKGPYEPTWESFKKYECPEWFRDAKFGIFMHWSVNSVVPGANDGWYGRNMYLQKGAPWGKAYAFHVANFGHPSQVGYKDIIPLWKAEHFDPNALVALYKQAGARYIVPVAVHHDNFDCYASSHQPWNSVNMGPKRDIIGEWEKAARKAGLRFGASSHSDRAWGWYEFCRSSDSEGPLKGVPYDGVQTKADGRGKWWDGYDPVDIYGPVLKPGGWRAQDKADNERYHNAWLNRTLELVNKYHLDLLYFDSGIPMGDLGMKVTASLYNNGMKNGRNEAVLNIKWNPPRACCVEDLEKGLSGSIRPFPWQLDASINNMWFADELPLELTAAQIVHTLTDCASKNGNLLLNVALRADGTIDSEERTRLLEVGAWLAVNGEAIYGTRPTHLWGEGPTLIKTWLSVDKKLPAFTSRDIRFTARGDTLYAIVMRLPRGKAHVQALRRGAGIFDGDIQEVKILGCDQPVSWAQDDMALHVTIPASLTGKPISDLGVTLKITGLRELKRDGVTHPLADGVIHMNCWDAQVVGDKLAPMDFEPALVNWDNPKEFPTWRFRCSVPGTYAVQAYYSAPRGEAQATLHTPGGDLEWVIAETANAKDFRLTTIGTIKLKKAEQYTLSVMPVEGHWKAIDLAYVQLKDPVMRPGADGSVELAALDARRHGTRCFVQTQGGEPNIGGWTSSAEWLGWEQVQFPTAGVYTIKIQGAAANGCAAFNVSVGEQRAACATEKSESWDRLESNQVGQITIKQPGVYSVEMHPQEGRWNPVNLARLSFHFETKPPF